MNVYTNKYMSIQSHVNKKWMWEFFKCVDGYNDS